MIFHENILSFQTVSTSAPFLDFLQTLGIHESNLHILEYFNDNYVLPHNTLADQHSFDSFTSFKQVSNATSTSHSLTLHIHILILSPSAFCLINISSIIFPLPRTSTQIKLPSKYLEAYHYQLLSQTHAATAHPITKYLSNSKLSSDHGLFTTFFLSNS